MPTHRTLRRSPADVPARSAGRTKVHASGELEEQLRHVQRLVLQGELAATAVHEISNLLTIVMFNAGLLRLSHQTEPAALKHIEPILHATGVIGSLCSQLRNLSRPTPAQLRVMDLTEITKRTFTLLDLIILRELVLETEEGAPVLITADPAHIDQILVNLVLNARDATADTDGRIRVRVGHRLGPRGGDRTPFLEVVDNGTGMTRQIRRRIFQTFFTTKPQGRGTGLGLVTVRRLVQGMGGRIKLTSQPGEGTSVCLLFPSPTPEDLAQQPPAVPQLHQSVQPQS